MNDAHGWFQAWLTAGADGDPPRDVAVHASVCAACRQSMAAMDLLTIVDPGLAGMPSPPPVIARSGLAHPGRLASAAAGVVFSAVILGIGASQLIALSRDNQGGPIAQASQTPAQGVLGGAQTPEPTTSSQPASAESLTPLATPEPTPRPGGSNATPRPSPSPTSNATLTPSPGPTGAPSLQPTASPTPMPTGTATPAPSDTATPAPTDTPTPAPTDTPTPSPSPTPAPTAPDAPQSLSPSSSATDTVDLSWSPPASDGRDAITGYNVYRGTSSSGETLYEADVSGLSFQDAFATSGTPWFYTVTAVNSYGESVFSTEVPIIP